MKNVLMLNRACPAILLFSVFSQRLETCHKTQLSRNSLVFCIGFPLIQIWVYGGKSYNVVTRTFRIYFNLMS